MNSSEGVFVARVDEFDTGDHRSVVVDGAEIGVINVDDEFYALENRCCHDGGPVCTGTVRNRLEAEFTGPGERVHEDYTGSPTITCPWHGWEYDMETGVHIGDATYSLRTYPVTVEEDSVYVLVREDE